ncbi:hypothetical protein ABZU76_17930 [Amycolatopsis sp. NPDC005232]|uniref:hypothetical protein n=1 Tax=Amycolatopsis sp. NPDC005232 TaxID=3157027 RepID=UPI0033BD0A06
MAEWVENGGPTLVITDVSPHRLGWVVGSQGERYMRTRMLPTHGLTAADVDRFVRAAEVRSAARTGEGERDAGIAA